MKDCYEFLEQPDPDGIPTLQDLDDGLVAFQMRLRQMIAEVEPTHQQEEMG